MCKPWIPGALLPNYQAPGNEARDYTSSVPKFYTFEWDGMPHLSVHLPTTNKQSRTEVHVVIKNSKKACMYNNISYSESSPYVSTLVESLNGPVVIPLEFAATMIV